MIHCRNIVSTIFRLISLPERLSYPKQFTGNIIFFCFVRIHFTKTLKLFRKSPKWASAGLAQPPKTQIVIDGTLPKLKCRENDLEKNKFKMKISSVFAAACLHISTPQFTSHHGILLATAPTVKYAPFAIYLM